jgi:hypothetical protein
MAGVALNRAVVSSQPESVFTWPGKGGYRLRSAECLPRTEREKETVPKGTAFPPADFRIDTHLDVLTNVEILIHRESIPLQVFTLVVIVGRLRLVLQER